MYTSRWVPGCHKLPAVDFLIARGDLHETRFDDGSAPVPQDGQAVLAVERFGLTSNNITYDKLSVET